MTPEERDRRILDLMEKRENRMIAITTIVALGVLCVLLAAYFFLAEWGEM